MNSITVSAFAKINLTLDVGSRREDGYHDIRSVMQTIALHDTLTVTRTTEQPGIQLEVSGEEAAGVPADGSNLVHRAAVRLQKLAAARGVLRGHETGVSIHLEKRIPSQAGLGGGSSDAAAMLGAINSLFALGLSRQRLETLGAALGADVPFFLTGGTALVEGLGERVTPLAPLAPEWPLVIVKPPVGILTAWAYHTLDEQATRRPGQTTAAWLSGGRGMGNDFEWVAMQVPEVASAWDFLQKAPERSPEVPPLLCGSGAALFCRTLDRAAAERLAERAAGVGMAWATHTTGSMA